jgi:hypothetical protein
MAIGPELLTENFLFEAHLFEEKIDHDLANSKVFPGGSVNISIPGGMKYSHFQILQLKYMKAGWKEVKWNSDQGEGDWLIFKS